MQWSASALRRARHHAALVDRRRGDRRPARSPTPARNWPSKPIHAMVPLAPGTGGDVVARLSFNRAGADARPADRHREQGRRRRHHRRRRRWRRPSPTATRCSFQSSTHAIAPALYTNLPYDTANDFAAVAPIGSVPSALVVSPSKGFRDLKEFVEKARGQSRRLHLCVGGRRLDHAPDRRAVPLQRGLQRGACAVPRRRLPARDHRRPRRLRHISPIATSVPNIKEGRLQALAVSSPKRAAACRTCRRRWRRATPNSDYVIWFGMFLPAKTPRAIVEQLADETMQGLEAAGAARAVGEGSTSARCR